jgi:hypothetical protein
MINSTDDGRGAWGEGAQDRCRQRMATDADEGSEVEGERMEREEWRRRRTAHEGEHRLFRLLGLGSGARAHAPREGRGGEGTIGVVLLAVLHIGDKLAIVSSGSGGTAREAHSPLALGWVDATTAAAAAAAAAVVGLVQVEVEVEVVVEICCVVPRWARGRGRGRGGYHCCTCVLAVPCVLCVLCVLCYHS